MRLRRRAPLTPLKPGRGAPGGICAAGGLRRLLPERQVKGCGQPAQTIRIGNPTPLVAEDGLTSRAAVGAFLASGGVHGSGNAVQGEALALTGLGDQLRERQMFH
jgi:hypothetical protein